MYDLSIKDGLESFARIYSFCMLRFQPCTVSGTAQVSGSWELLSGSCEACSWTREWSLTINLGWWWGALHWCITPVSALGGNLLTHVCPEPLGAFARAICFSVHPRNFVLSTDIDTYQLGADKHEHVRGGHVSRTQPVVLSQLGSIWPYAQACGGTAPEEGALVNDKLKGPDSLCGNTSCLELTVWFPTPQTDGPNS